MTSDHNKGVSLTRRLRLDADRTVCILGHKVVDVDVEAAFLVIFKPL